jgi:hypothetical protein
MSNMATVEEGTIPIVSKPARRRPNVGGNNTSGRPKNESGNRKHTEHGPSEGSNDGPEVALHHDHPLIREQISEEEGAEQCFICADPIKYRAVYPCGHVTCSKCALRLRVLIKDTACTFCRKEADSIVITESENMYYEEFSNDNLLYKDDKHGILFERRDTKDKVMMLLRLNCPDKTCPSAPFAHWKELKIHMQKAHGKALCEICTRHKKAFTVEFDYYTPKMLLKHEKEGDKKGFKGHPQCEFCRLRFYSSDELFVHCRDKHEKCFICERSQTGGPPYYENYERLEKHFEKEHFACNVQSCKDRKFVVFGTKVELQDHMVSEHSALVGKSKAARLVEPEFTFSRGNRSGFQGQLSTVQPPAISSSSSNSIGSRSTLTSDESAFPALGSQRTAPVAGVPLSVQTFHANTPPSDNSPEVLKRRLDERARIYLDYDTVKLDKFEQINGDFKASNVTAKDVVFEYSRLFPKLKESDMELLVQELAALYKNLPTKRKSLVDAFESWKEKQSFPQLGTKSAPGSRTNLAASWVAGRSNGSVRGGGALLTSKQDFPSLPSNPAKPTSSVAGQIGATRVVANSSPAASTSKISTDNFPALPASKARRPPPVKKPVAPVRSVWGPQSEPEPVPETANPPLGAQKKGKKKVIYRLGIDHTL